MPRVAIILPPREKFSAQATGAVGLIVRTMARPQGGADCTVFGMDPHKPIFADTPFKPVSLPWRPFGQASRYAAGVVGAVSAAQPDMIEVHNQPDLALHLARKFPRVPVTLFLHNDPQQMEGARTPGERAFLLARLAMVAPVSVYVRDRLMQGVESRAGVEVFPDFIDLDAMPRYAPQKCILFADRTVEEKGADSFVAACGRALKMLPGWRAEMIGSETLGSDAIETSYGQKLHADAEAAQVAMLGWRPLGEVLHAMAKAAIVVVPSRWSEPFGLTALLAMGCGVPLLCSGRGGLAELVGDAALAINPDDPAMIAAKIVALAYDAPRRAQLSQAGRARAAAFSATDALARLADLRAQVRAQWPQH